MHCIINRINCDMIGINCIKIKINKRTNGINTRNGIYFKIYWILKSKKIILFRGRGWFLNTENIRPQWELAPKNIKNKWFFKHFLQSIFSLISQWTKTEEFSLWNKMLFCYWVITKLFLWYNTILIFE